MFPTRRIAQQIALFTLIVSGASLCRAEFETTRDAQTVLGQPNANTGQPDRASLYPTSQSLWSPRGVSACGNWMFVADSNNQRVLGFAKDGNSFGKIAGLVLGKGNFTSNGTEALSASTLRFPDQLYCDPETQHLYVADRTVHRVLIYKNAGGLPAGAGHPADIVLGQDDFFSAISSAEKTGMNGPRSVFATANLVFVADSGNNRILLFSTTTVFGNSLKQASFSADAVLGGGDDLKTAGTSKTLLDLPTGVWSDGTNLLVADTSNRRILYWADVSTSMENTTPATGVVGQPNFTSNVRGLAARRFNTPYSVFYANNELIIGDTGNQRVLVYQNNPNAFLTAGFWDENGQPTFLGTPFIVRQGSDTGNESYPPNNFMNSPCGVHPELGKPGNYWIADIDNHRIVKFESDRFTNAWGQSSVYTNNANNGPRVDGMFYPGSVTVGSGKTFVTDSYNHRILVYNSTSPQSYSSPTTVLGQDSLTSNEGGAVVNAQSFKTPMELTIDEKNLFIADTRNNRILYWDLANPIWNDRRPADGVIGQFDLVSNAAGNSTLNIPNGVYSDGKRLFVADTGNHRVLVWKFGQENFGIPASAIVLGGTRGNSDSRMDQPMSVYSDGLAVYVAERGNHRVSVWNDVEKLIVGGANKADFVLGQSGFNVSDPCIHPPTAMDKDRPCLSEPQSIKGDGQRLFVSHYSYSPESSNAGVRYGRVLEWKLPITANNQKPTQKLWESISGATAKTLGAHFVRVSQLYGNDLWVADRGYHRVLKFSDATSPYVNVAVTTRTVPATLAQKDVVSALKIDVGTVTGNHSLRWSSLSVRQEGGLPGDIEKVFLCSESQSACNVNTAIATLSPTATPGLFRTAEGFNSSIPSTNRAFTLAYLLSPTAKVSQTVGIALQVNGGFMSFWDTMDRKNTYVNNIPGPARVSGVSEITDASDTLVVVSTQNLATANVAQNIYLPFLQFDIKANEDQVSWETLKLKLKGDAPVSGVKARLLVSAGGVFSVIKEGLTFDGATRTATIAVDRILSPVTERYKIELLASAETTGTLGVEINATLAPFGVGAPDSVQSFTTFGSAVRDIVSHAANNLIIAGVPLVAEGQTAEQSSRVVVAKVTAHTDQDWTYLSRWPLTRLGVQEPKDVTAFELWKDDGDGIFDSAKDLPLAEAPHPEVGAIVDLEIDPALRINVEPSTLWVTVLLSQNATPGNPLGVVLDTVVHRLPDNTDIVLTCDPNTTKPNNFFIETASLTIEPSHDVVSVESQKLPKSLEQASVNTDMLQLKVWTNKNTADWSSLKVKLEGTAAVSDIALVSLFRSDDSGRTLVAKNTFSGRETTLTFSTAEPLTTSTSTYFLSVNVADLAVPNRTVVLSLVNKETVRLKEAADTVSSAGFSHDTSASTIVRYKAKMEMTAAAVSANPVEVEINQKDVLVARLSAQVDKSYADWNQIQISLTGSGVDDSDVVNVSLYGSNGDDVFNQSDQFIASAPVISGQATLTFSAKQIHSTPSAFLIGVTISATASPGDEIVLGFNSGDLRVISPATALLSNENGFQAQPLIIKEPLTNLMLTEWTSLAPAEAFQTQANVELAAFGVRMSGYSGQWRSLRLDRADDADFLDSDVKTVRLLLDNGITPGRYDESDRQVAEAAFVNGSATLIFSADSVKQTLTVTPRPYLLTFDVAGNADFSKTVRVKLAGAGNFDLSPDGVDGSGFPFSTEPTRLRPTIDGLLLDNPGSVNVAPSLVTQGTGPTRFLHLNLKAQTNQVTWQGLVIESSGTLLDSAITHVRLYEDRNTNGLPDEGEDMTRGQPSFSQNRVTLRPREDVLVPTSDQGIKTFIVAIDISRLAPVGSTVQMKIRELLVQSPDFVVNAGNLGIGNPTPSTIVDRPDIVTPVTVALTHLVYSPTVFQGARDAAVLRIQLHTNEDAAQWTELRAQLVLDSAQPLKPRHFESFTLFKDSDGSGRLDKAETLSPLATGQLLGQEVVFTLLQPETLTSSGVDYFLAVDLSLDAPPGEPFSLTLQNANSLKINFPDQLAWLAQLNTLPLQVQNVTSPTTPIVADYEDPAFATQDFISGQFTPPDIVGKGQFSASALQIPFTWASQMTPGHGGISIAEYCVGTLPGTCDKDWRPIPPNKNVFLAQGLNLAHGATYYISVRSASDRYGKFSGIGVSNGIIIDQLAPSTPVMGEPFVESSGYSLLWPPVAPTLSGLAGYIVEERTESKPTWKTISSVRAGLARPELTTDGLSLTFTDKEPGTYYYRLTAVNGVGTPSTHSPAVRVNYSIAQTASFLSSASNYPNPFDSNDGPTKITYTLRAASDVQMRFYDGFGRQVREMRFSAGSLGGEEAGNTVEWDGTDDENQPLPQGTYVIRLNAGGEDVRWKIGVWR